MRYLAQCLLICLVTASLRGQSTKSELFGTVRDSTGLVIGQASVQLIEASTGSVVTVESNATGAFHFLGLANGTYELVTAKNGFASLRRTGIVLRVGDRVSVDVELSLGDASQSITVSAAPPLLQASRGTSSVLVDQQKVINLPLDGRNFVPLLALSPGISLPPGSLLPRVNGSRPRTSEYIYDGISVLQPEPGQVAFYPIVDAIEEFRVETNSYSAEYGRSNGGVIMVNQKSGSNILHGTLFEFFRNEALNARNLFATASAKPVFRRNQYGFVLGGPVRRNKTFFFADWQGTRLNTGVVRTSTVPTSAQRRGMFAQPIFDPNTTRQTTAGYTRDSFPSNTVPLTMFDPSALAVVGRYPLPNVFAGTSEATASNYRRVGLDATAQDQFDVRLDHQLAAGQRVFARYSYLRDNSRPATPLPDGGGTFAATYIGKTLTRADSLVAEHSWNLTPMSLNQARFGFTRRGFDRSALATGQSIAVATKIPNLPLTSFADVLPSFDIVGLQQLGPPASSNARFTTSVTQFVDNYSWSRGGHSIKAGTDIRIERLDALQPPSPTGNFQFSNVFTAGLDAEGAPLANTGSSFASFLLGQVTRFSIDAQSQVLRPRASIAEFFLQDDWRISRRLSVNLGVRYTLNIPSTVARDQGAVFNLSTQKLDYLGQNGFPRSARNLEKTNFGPRVGLAYKVADSLVVRSGYSLTWIEQTGITTPFTVPMFPFIQTLGQQTLDNIRPAFTLSNGPSVVPQLPGPDAGLGQGVFGVQRNNGSGYAQQWNLSLQKTFRDNWSVEAGYLGSKLTRLGVPDVNLNQLTIDQLRLGSQLTQQVANPYFGQIPAHTSLGAQTIARAQLLRAYPKFTSVALYRNNTGHSTYHSFQSRIEKRFSQGLTFSLAYTFSRLIDDAGAVFDSAVLTGPATNFQAADSSNKRLEKDVSTGNVPHVISSGGVYELPFGRGRAHALAGWRDWLAGGWQVAGLVRLQSGSPLAVTQATNLNAFAGFGIQRPNRLADSTLPAGERTTARYFDTTAFAQAPQFTIGNGSRNPVNGPAYRTADVMAGKTFVTSERLRIEFRAEAFNVTNTPPLGAPNTSFGIAAFGSITTALDPRVFEFVVKLHF
jgi:Carboxypeptidase regulatory-like domain/TonB dependent receptor